MNYGFYLCLCLSLIVIQTSVLSEFFDLLIPVVIYLAIAQEIVESLVIIIVIGFIMDNISACVFGLFGISYLCLYFVTIFIMTFMDIENRIFLALLTMAGVLMQNIIFLGDFILFNTGFELNGAVIKIILMQSLLALITGMFLFIYLKQLHQGWINLLSRWTDN